MEKFQENLEQAVRSLQIADHMAYVTLPLVNEQRLLLKILDEIHKSVINCVNAILNYEYLYKRIQLYENNDDNFQTFVNKCSKNYSLSNEQVKKIKEIVNLNKKYKQSAMEFVKKDKVIILSDNLNVKTLNLREIKGYLLVAKELLMKTNSRIKGRISSYH